ncbi:DUF881 domain-containing protein [Candidatus Berkelbacteria bacterium]|nr:DUF881 domain-containing protein [Candidatus Berkelbacteria bacterium]
MLKAIFLVVGLMVGILVMLQARVRPTRSVNPIEPYAALVDLRTQLESKEGELKTKLEAATEKRNQIEKQLKQSKSDSRLLDEIEKLETTAGQRPVSGQGVIITLDDSHKGQPTIENIVHASDLRDVVNVGYLAGASAISVNGQRLTANSSIDSSVNTIMVNNQRVSNPFTVRMLGDSGALARELARHSNLAELNNRAKTAGLLFHIEELNRVEIEVYHGSLKTEFARIADDH